MQQTFKQSHSLLCRDEYPIETNWATRISEHPPPEDHWYIMVHCELVANKQTEDAGDECKTQDVGINTDLPVIE